MYPFMQIRVCLFVFAKSLNAKPSKPVYLMRRVVYRRSAGSDLERAVPETDHQRPERPHHSLDAL